MACFCLLQLLTTVIHSVSTLFVVLAFSAVTYFFLKIVSKLLFPNQSSVLNEYREQWFGKELDPPKYDVVKENTEDTSIRPFKIDVPKHVLTDLNARLENTRFEDPVEDSKFLYGFNPNYLRKVVDYWRREYDWRKHERMLNEFPQFKTRIEGIDVHFMHVKPNLPEQSKIKVIPILIIHGWPGSVNEFYKVIPLLTAPRKDYDFVFEVVAPSVPGFGFSESPHRAGFTARAAARVFVTMMERIGHEKFYVQGGDWGSVIAHLMARYYPWRVLGLHMNMYIWTPRPWEAFKYLVMCAFPFLVSKAECKNLFPLKRFLKMLLDEGAYFHMQSTKTDTLGAGMSDSPAGMAAYLLEKFSYATNPEYIELEDGGLTRKFSLDELLTIVTVQWVNNNFTAASRFYKENLWEVFESEHRKVPVVVPSGIAVFPNEVLMLPKACMSEQIKNLVSFNVMPRGGHFAPLEEPELLSGDIWQFVKKVESLK